jgi:hypothetical protein
VFLGPPSPDPLAVSFARELLNLAVERPDLSLVSFDPFRAILFQFSGALLLPLQPLLELVGIAAQLVPLLPEILGGPPLLVKLPLQEAGLLFQARILCLELATHRQNLSELLGSVFDLPLELGFLLIKAYILRLELVAPGFKPVDLAMKIPQVTPQAPPDGAADQDQHRSEDGSEVHELGSQQHHRPSSGRRLSADLLGRTLPARPLRPLVVGTAYHPSTRMAPQFFNFSRPGAARRGEKEGRAWQARERDCEANRQVDRFVTVGEGGDT